MSLGGRSRLYLNAVPSWSDHPGRILKPSAAIGFILSWRWSMSMEKQKKTKQNKRKSDTADPGSRSPSSVSNVHSQNTSWYSPEKREITPASRYVLLIISKHACNLVETRTRYLSSTHMHVHTHSPSQGGLCLLPGFFFFFNYKFKLHSILLC